MVDVLDVRTSPTGSSWERIRLFSRQRLVTSLTSGLTRMYVGDHLGLGSSLRV